MYTVYHIPGVKFGCTNDLERRSKSNRRKYGKDISIDIVKVFDDIDDADEFEEFCNDEAGYTHGNSYKNAVKASNIAKISPNHVSNSIEAREKISKSSSGVSRNKGIPKSAAQVLKMKDGRTANHGKDNGMYGKKSPMNGKKLMNDGTQTFAVESEAISTFLICGCSIGRHPGCKKTGPK